MAAFPGSFLAASLRPSPVDTPLADAPSGAAGRDNWLSDARRLLDRLPLTRAPASLGLARCVAGFVIGIAATIAWQSCFAPALLTASAAVPADEQQLNAIMLDTIRRNVDQLAASVAAIQERMTNGVDRLGAGQELLAAGQDEMTAEIGNLKSVLARTADMPLPRPAPAPAQRSSQASVEVDSASDWKRQPCCRWPASSQR